MCLLSRSSGVRPFMPTISDVGRRRQSSISCALRLADNARHGRARNVTGSDGTDHDDLTREIARQLVRHGPNMRQIRNQGSTKINLDMAARHTDCRPLRAGVLPILLLCRGLVPEDNCLLRGSSTLLAARGWSEPPRLDDGPGSQRPRHPQAPGPSS